MRGCEVRYPDNSVEKVLELLGQAEPVALGGAERDIAEDSDALPLPVEASDSVGDTLGELEADADAVDVSVADDEGDADKAPVTVGATVAVALAVTVELSAAAPLPPTPTASARPRARPTPRCMCSWRAPCGAPHDTPTRAAPRRACPRPPGP